ncbi:MAG: hypothetical protein ABIR29_03875, partial [Chthoniobacterales bacterium]
PAGVGIPQTTLVAAQQEWMPHLLTEVAAYQNGTKPPLPESAKPAATPAPPPNEKPASGDDDLSAAVAASPAPSPAAANGDLLGGNSDDLSAAVAASPTPAAGGNDDLSGDLTAEAAAPAPSATPTATPVAAKSPEDWATAGGWFRPQESFTLFYRPSAHADPFLVAWLNTSAKLAEKTAPVATLAFQELTDPQAAGACMKCHTVTADKENTHINWLSAESTPKKKSFTTFRHTTHLFLFGNTACATCHTIDSKADYAKYFRGETGALAARDPSKFQSNFSPLSKTLCIQCHQPKVAGDSCLLCHRYHAGPSSVEVAGKNKLRPLLGGK